MTTEKILTVIGEHLGRCKKGSASYKALESLQTEIQTLVSESLKPAKNATYYCSICDKCLPTYKKYCLECYDKFID